MKNYLTLTLNFHKFKEIISLHLRLSEYWDTCLLIS